MSDPRLLFKGVEPAKKPSTGFSLFRRKKTGGDKDDDDAVAAVQERFAEMRRKDWRVATVVPNDAFGLGMVTVPASRGRGALIDEIKFGGPAADAKVLREGDLIVKIKEHDCCDLSHAEIVKLLAEAASDREVEMEVINPDSADRSDTTSMRGDDDNISLHSTTSIRSHRPSGLSNPGLAAGPRASSIVSPTASAPASATNAGPGNSVISVTVSGGGDAGGGAGDAGGGAAGYVDLTNGPLNKQVLAEVQGLRSVERTAQLSAEQAAARDDELRRKGYILPDEIASTNTKKAGVVLPRPSADSSMLTVVPPVPPRSVGSSPSHVSTVSPITPTSAVLSPTASGYIMPSPGPAAAQRVPVQLVSQPPPSSAFSPASSATVAGPTAATAPASAPSASNPVPAAPAGAAVALAPPSAAAVVSTPSSPTPPRGPFFIGPANGDMAAVLLNGKEDGSFVLRESLRARGEFALSVKFGATIHQIAISHDPQGYRIGRAHSFVTICQLIKFYQTTSLDQHFSALKTTLLHPRGTLDFAG